MRQSAQPISKLIKDFRKTLGVRQVKKQHGITQVWAQIVGASIAPHTRITGERQGVLLVKVDSAPVLAELANFRKAEILKKLCARWPAKTYRDINFMVDG